MGTRGLLGHIIRSKNIRKGCYKQMDAYPSGLGQDIARFINSLTDQQIERMIENLSKVEWIEDNWDVPSKDIRDRYTVFGFWNAEGAASNPEDWYCTLRNVEGAVALPHILDGTLKHLVDQTICEDSVLFTYWVDWEERTVTMYGDGCEKSMGFKDFTPKRMAKS